MNRQAQCCDQAAHQDKLHPSFATQGGKTRGVIVYLQSFIFVIFGDLDIVLSE